MRPPQRSYALLGHSDPATAGQLAYAINGADLIPVLAFDLPHVITRLRNVPRDAQFELILLGPTLTDHDLPASIDAVRARTNAAIITLSDHNDLHARATDTEEHLPVTTPAAIVALHAAALLTQQPGFERTKSAWGPLNLDHATFEVRWDTTMIPLTPMQFGILDTLVQAGGATVTVEHIGRTVYGQTITPDDERIRAHIRRIRQRLAVAAPGVDSLLCTVRGIGYRLAPAHHGAGDITGPPASASARQPLGAV